MQRVQPLYYRQQCECSTNKAALGGLIWLVTLKQSIDYGRV